MSKKFTEKRALNVEGLIDTDEMTIDIEDVGTKTLEEILKRYNGNVVKITVGFSDELE